MVSGVVTLIGAVITARVSIYLAQKSVTAQAEQKSKELTAQADLKLKELTAQAEAMRQTQLTEIVRKRIETYPAFYEILAVYGRNWEIEGKSRNQEWAASFLKALIENNARNGAFFSQGSIFGMVLCVLIWRS